MNDNINLSVSFRPFFSNVYCKADARFYDVLQVQISSWPLWIQQIISFVTTVTFIFPILTVVWLVFNSTVSFPLESMVNSIAKRLAGVFSVECHEGSTSHNHFGQSQWTQKIRRTNQNSMRTHVADKRRAKMVKSESRVVLVLLLIRQLKTVLGMQMNMRNSYI